MGMNVLSVHIFLLERHSRYPSHGTPSLCPLHRGCPGAPDGTSRKWPAITGVPRPLPFPRFRLGYLGLSLLSLSPQARLSLIIRFQADVHTLLFLFLRFSFFLSGYSTCDPPRRFGILAGPGSFAAPLRLAHLARVVIEAWVTREGFLGRSSSWARRFVDRRWCSFGYVARPPWPAYPRFF